MTKLPDVTLEIEVDGQRAVLYRGGVPDRYYSVSTASEGVGTEAGSLRTPLGRFRVAEKIGGGEPLGAVFRGRVPTGEVCRADGDDPRWESGDDLVLSRILWLEGLDPENANTRERLIYLHGTNQERRLGKPASHGCIRFANADILELFDLLDIGTEVRIV